MAHFILIVNDLDNCSLCTHWFRLSHECEVLHAAQVPGTAQDHLQVFNIETKTKMKSHQMTEQVQICK